MLEKKDINKIEEAVSEFFEKMTIAVSAVKTSLSSEKGENAEDKEVVGVDIKIEEPQVLIGQQGQTLFEIQRLLRTVLNKKFQTNFYFNLDINDYKKKKIDYLKVLAKDLADQVSLAKEEKILSPMSSYERRAIHAELANRDDVITESQGEGLYRHIVIKPK
jgi:spoIIIJ-associated protein